MFHPVKNPRHYAGDGKISCKDALQSMMSKVMMQPEKAYWWGVAFKYLWRWPHKDGRRDLEKCKQCIDYLLELSDDVAQTVQPEKVDPNEIIGMAEDLNKLIDVACKVAERKNGK